jgi:hypothetical protein
LDRKERRSDRRDKLKRDRSLVSKEKGAVRIKEWGKAKDLDELKYNGRKTWQH